MLTKFEKARIRVQKKRREKQLKHYKNEIRWERLSYRLRNPKKRIKHFKIDPNAPKMVKTGLGYVKLPGEVYSRIQMDGYLMGNMANAIRAAIIAYYLRHDPEIRSDFEFRCKIKKDSISLPNANLPDEIKTIDVRNALIAYYSNPFRLKTVTNRSKFKKRKFNPMELPHEILTRIMADVKFSEKKIAAIALNFYDKKILEKWQETREKEKRMKKPCSV